MKGNSKAKTPQEYIDSLLEPRKSEIRALHQFIRKTVPALKPTMAYGMIGYGIFHYRYASGREGDWPIVGLGSQKNYISIYVCAADGKQYVAEKYKQELPKANIGKSCIRFRHPADVDLKVIAKILKEGERMMKKGKVVA